MRALLIAAALLTCGPLLAETKAAAQSADKSAQAPAPAPRVALRTNQGVIVVELDPVRAPNTVGNFLEYVKAGFYNGTIFHRVIPDFMIQGGGYNAGLQYKPTRPPIQNEATNGLKNTRGTIAMARTNDPHSASSQFFINLVDNAFLDYRGEAQWGYAVFGKVVEGMDVVDKIAKIPTTARSAEFANFPTEPVVIEKAELLAK